MIFSWHVRFCSNPSASIFQYGVRQRSAMPDFKILGFRVVSFVISYLVPCSLLQHTEFYQHYILLKYGDITIFKMSVVRHFEFSQFDIVTFDHGYWRIFASSCKILRKSDNPLPSYDQKRCFPIWRPSTILNLKF